MGTKSPNLVKYENFFSVTITLSVMVKDNMLLCNRHAIAMHLGFKITINYYSHGEKSVK